MATKDWVKTEDKPNIVIYQHKTTKDYNIGRSKHLQVGEKYRIFSINVIRISKGWYKDDVEDRLESNAVWTVDDYTGIHKTFPTKFQALSFARKYMRSH